MNDDAQPVRHEYHSRGAAVSPNDAHLLTSQCYAVVLAGGRGSRLHNLTDWRAKPAVPFAGKLKIIDFPLSNCVNSGIRRIAVLTQYKSQSLIRHIERGWSFLSPSLGEFIDIAPAQQQLGESWYAGTADAVYQNLHLVRDSGARHVLILAGDHVYKMNYAAMLADHVRAGADATVACIEVPIAQARHFGIITVDAQARVRDFIEKPSRAQPMADGSEQVLASMGIYVFDIDFLCEQLARDASDPASSHDFGKDLLPRLVAGHRVLAHRFADSCVNMVGERPYWRDVGTVDAYWEANMDLTTVQPELNLYDDHWPVISLQPQLPPAKFVFDDDSRRGVAVASLVSSGCIVSGATVRRSILFAKVRVGEHSVIEDSLVLPDVVVGRHVILRKVVVDKRCMLPDGFCAGVDPQQDRARFHVTEGGVTLITPAMLAALGEGPVPGADEESGFGALTP
ncbi:MAG: glucose-1-phosphate adenylyltransferase [Rhodoferax sp.]|nr:glucose-1-phosphate adenylyltransferase [Rhodoferax sp.]MCB2005143.1 glucose-1-phosphate adenylyltransferase [Rhodoferax sp.]MCP5260410.1 glucose-1-phosphate adenylyltransferase [Rhodoferax sp.]MCW5629321.1 glucose-1-phosphate adenylyltransferase [Rhodoferax sp.]